MHTWPVAQARLGRCMVLNCQASYVAPGLESIAKKRRCISSALCLRLTALKAVAGFQTHSTGSVGDDARAPGHLGRN